MTNTQDEQGEEEGGSKRAKGHHGPIRLWPWIVLVLAVILLGLWAVEEKSKRADRKIKEQQAVALVLSQQRDAWARYTNTFNGCLRGNIIREQQRASAVVQKATIDEVITFLTSSAEFRRSQGQEDLAIKAERSKKRLEVLAKTLHPPEDVICEDIILPPSFPEPPPSPTPKSN